MIILWYYDYMMIFNTIFQIVKSIIVSLVIWYIYIWGEQLPRHWDYTKPLQETVKKSSRIFYPEHVTVNLRSKWFHWNEAFPVVFVTLPETNSKRTYQEGIHPKRKRESLPTIHFQVRLLLVSGRVPGDFVKVKSLFKRTSFGEYLVHVKSEYLEQTYGLIFWKFCILRCFAYFFVLRHFPISFCCSK